MLIMLLIAILQGILWGLFVPAPWCFIGSFLGGAVTALIYFTYFEDQW